MVGAGGTSVRLQNGWTPSQYTLAVKVKLENWTFTAEEEIHLSLRTAGSPPTEKVTLHCGKNITIDHVEGAQVFSRDEAHELVVFQLSGAPADTHRIRVQYHSDILEEMKGFYRCNYSVNGQAKRMASTHFEPMGARRFYICQDEPAARATFALTVLLPTQDGELTVLSNAPLKTKTPSGQDWIAYQFEDMPKCPPYLTALSIGDLECIERTQNGKPVRFWTTKGSGKIAKAHFGLDVACHSLQFFEKFFQSPYPLPKLDLVAVPDFPIGGMENWGLICLVESVLVEEGGPTPNSLRSLKGACSLITHEVSHNWFGNLVGIDWWEGLWLKEGFASWCGYFGMNDYRPNWLANDDVADEIFEALDTDGRKATHPIEAPIPDPAHITEVFDAISYDKGMAVVKMLHAYLGEERFSNGLSAYIKRYSYQSTKTHQLWDSLEETSGLPISQVMKGFTKEPGYPIVSVNFHSSASEAGFDTVTLSQEKYCIVTNQSHLFASGGQKAVAPEEAFVWTVPIHLLNDRGERTSFMLEKPTQTFPLPAGFGSHTKWIKANPSHTGFFRCRYPAVAPTSTAEGVHSASPSFNALCKHFAELSPIDQRGFQNDCFALFQAAHVSVEDILKVIDAVSHTPHLEYGVLNDYLQCLEGFVENFADQCQGASTSSGIANSQVDFEHVLLKRATVPVFSLAPKLYLSGLEPNTTPQVKLLRRICLEKFVGLSNKLTPRAIALEDPVVGWLKAQGEGLLFHGKQVDSDTTYAAIVAALTYSGDQPAFEALWKLFLQSQDNADLCRVLVRALCSDPYPEHFDFMVKEVMEAQTVRVQYGGIVFAAWAASRNAHRVWPMVQQQFPTIDRLWGGGQFRIQSIVTSIGSTLHGEKAAAEFTHFFKLHPLPNAALAIQRAIEGITLRGVLRSQFGARLSGLLLK